MNNRFTSRCQQLKNIVEKKAAVGYFNQEVSRNAKHVFTSSMHFQNTGILFLNKVYQTKVIDLSQLL